MLARPLIAAATPRVGWSRPLRASGAGDVDRYTPSDAPDFVPPTRAQLLSAVAAPQAFPQAWQGRWKGNMAVSGVPGKEKVGVELEIRPHGQDGRASWTLRYEGMPDRQYELVPVRPEVGHYAIDERNGIQLDSYLEGNVLMSQFEVQRNRVTARYELDGDKILMEMNMFGREPVRETGHGVRVFGLGSLQRAVLTREPD